MSKYSTDALRVSYGVGRQFGSQLKAQPFEGLDISVVAEGVRDAFEGLADPVEPEAMQAAFNAIREQLEAQAAVQFDEVRKAGETFLADNAAKEGVQVTESGLQYEVLVNGDGAKPGLNSTVRTHYSGTLINGREFDSSYNRGQPAEFPVSGVIAGWTEALQLMTVGSKWRLTIPHNLAYGAQGAGDAIGPYETLVFDIELIDIL